MSDTSGLVPKDPRVSSPVAATRGGEWILVFHPLWLQHEAVNGAAGEQGVRSASLANSRSGKVVSEYRRADIVRRVDSRQFLTYRAGHASVGPPGRRAGWAARNRHWERDGGVKTDFLERGGVKLRH
ncbi:hypothetical protein C8R44DRAFT_735643 [Mycena epipterygia]|nr:hypothetical protein C8R44DRAFT_735643 [Mycena epipterygia]